MAEEFRFAWMVYSAGTLVLLLAGWWFMRNWSWAWLRWLILTVTAAALLAPTRWGEPDTPVMPVLPLFVYQTLFDQNGATPEVTASLVIASGGAAVLVILSGLGLVLIRRLRARRREREEDPYLNAR
ncbi:hypothetical protein [Microbulbifer discodermiae]|uniref:hypothetical protein n=1 Tax=Microbulbifer sp. 2201CG32-9 TaxID=3232309 RepID=UPI00345C0BC9